jgi:hypothetical protein
MEETIEQIENQVMNKALDIAGKHLAAMAHHYFMALNECKGIKDLPCHGEEMKQQRENVLKAPIGMLKELIKMNCGLASILEDEKPGEGLLKGIMIIPTQNFRA